MSKAVEKKLRRLGIDDAPRVEQMTRTFDRIAFNKDDEIIEQEIEEDAEDLAETESKVDVKIISQESETDETEVEELDKPWDRELDAT